MIRLSKSEFFQSKMNEKENQKMNDFMFSEDCFQNNTGVSKVKKPVEFRNRSKVSSNPSLSPSEDEKALFAEKYNLITP